VFRGFGKYKLVYNHLWSTYGQFWALRISFGLRLVTRICKLIVLPIAISLIITNLSRKNFGGAYEAVFLFVSFSLLIGIATPLTKYIGMRGENKAYNTITGNYFSNLVHADLDYFHSNLAGYLTTATRQYVDSCMTLVRTLRDRYTDTVLSIVFPLCVIFWLDPWLGLVALLLSSTQAAYLFWASHIIAPYRSRSREMYKRNSGRMADIVSNILAVKSTAQEATRVEQIKRASKKEADLYAERYTMQAKLIGLRECITVTFFAVLLLLTVYRMSGGFISITAAILVVTYTTTILASVYTLSDDLDEHDDLIDKIMPAFEIINRQNSVNDPKHPKTFRHIKGNIRLNNIAFSYEKGRPVFDDFSLSIPAGQKIGIVGLSGAGKSTLTKLLLRFNDVNAGEILIDNVDIRQVKQTDLRGNIAYVPQEPLLFHASIQENVLLARPNASEKEVEQALKAAHAWEFIKQLPDGIESIVGERGVKLSGGQKQRIAIARAVLRQAPIMILDEATSALDSESEQIIKDSFAEILKGKTAIVIAHRLSTLSEMDRIVVIENGTYVEDGTHKELLAKNGTYGRLWKRQQQHIEDPLETVTAETIPTVAA